MQTPNADAYKKIFFIQLYSTVEWSRIKNWKVQMTEINWPKLWMVNAENYSCHNFNDEMTMFGVEHSHVEIKIKYRKWEMDCQNGRNFCLWQCVIDRLQQRHLSCYEIRRWDDHRTSVSISELSFETLKSSLVSHIQRVGPKYGTQSKG